MIKATVKEWYNWGKESYKGARNTINRNKHHPDYSTDEKIKAIHDDYKDCYMLSDEKRKDLIERFGYTDDEVECAFGEFKKGYDSSRKWYEKADKKYQNILDEYKDIFNKAERVANSVDVSDIVDGFPCGSAHLYLQDYPEGADLRKAIAHFSTSGDSSIDAFKYKLPIKMPSYGQCISYDEKVCSEVRDFLRSNGIFTSVYSWID